ncbi:hypothetical protein [Pedobacter sp. L105]|uniref:hypothetical protein n=1 Tax=Pedobacter sp. L105 TaxID=1641871 RepID=UPI00131A6765|nr:hypothetical protein [Pedobacter sp. L105]
MNFTPSTIIILLVVAAAIIYLIAVLRRTQQFPFAKALNLSYTKDMLEADEYKKSLSPILEEIETQQVAKFIRHWSDKFESKNLTVNDVESLNAQIAAGASNQVNGILAIHPDGRKMFNLINEDLKLKTATVA